MLKTFTINPENLQRANVVKAECVNCDRIEYIETTAISDALDELHHAGWRAYEIPGEMGEPACPSCIQNMKSEDK